MDRQFWTAEDVRALLTVWAEDSVQQKIDGVCRNEDVMKHIAAEMAKLGIWRTTQQVREKLKKLRAQYKAVKLHNRGAVHQKKFPYFDLMDSVLGHRPKTSGNTTTLQEPGTDMPQATEPACSITPPESASSPRSCLSVTPISEETTNPGEVEDVPSFLSAATSVPARPSTSTSHLKEPFHHVPPRTRAGPKRRRVISHLDFIAAMEKIAEKDREAEKELRLQEARLEEQLRREEMEQFERLMEQRSRETQDLMALLTALHPQKPVD